MTDLATKAPSSTASPFEKLAKRARSTVVYSRAVTAIQMLIDAAGVGLAYGTAFWVYTAFLDRTSPQSGPQFALFAVATALIYVIALDRLGMYRREVSLLNIKELRGVVRAALYTAAIILSATFYIRSLDFSRITLTIAFVLTPATVYTFRLFLYRLQLWIHSQGWAQKRVLIYGAGNIGTHLAKRLFESPTLGMLPIGFLDDDASRVGTRVSWRGPGPKAGLPVLGGEESLERLEFDQLLIALPSASFERNQSLVEHCVQHAKEYLIVPNAYEQFIQRVELMEIGGIPLLKRREGHASWLYLLSKRVVDFALSLILIMLLSPLLLLFWIWIKSDSPGPVIFKQKRVGLNGREFSFYKFRTMFVDAPKYATSPDAKTDPRITRAGRWLRRTSLDEIPQLFNVLRGDMSLVGPRPEMPFIVAGYSALERERLKAKPGITGVWQISAVRGEPIHKNIEYDLFYIENRSMLLDLAVLIKTALSVIRGIGAV